MSYSVPDVTGHSFNWAVDGGSIISGNGSHQISVDWEIEATGPVSLIEEVISTGCKVESDVYNVAYEETIL